MNVQLIDTFRPFLLLFGCFAMTLPLRLPSARQHQANYTPSVTDQTFV